MPKKQTQVTVKIANHGLEMKVFPGEKAKYLVFKSSRRDQRKHRNQFHVFMEVDAKEAAADCGENKGQTPQQRWGKLWRKYN